LLQKQGGGRGNDPPPLFYDLLNQKANELTTFFVKEER
jgi:hypothetical protein